MLMAVVTYGLWRPGRVNQPPAGTALQEGALCDPAQTPGTSLSPQTPCPGWVPDGGTTAAPFFTQLSLLFIPPARPDFPLSGCAGAEGLTITPFSFTPLLSRTAATSAVEFAAVLVISTPTFPNKGTVYTASGFQVNVYCSTNHSS